jgi:UDP-N-acetylmuramate: L-alanyl-gamma-D-glutamyl-meso-diaminopimelate ligase
MTSPSKTSEKNGETGKHIHLLGICGTFMGGVAALAREAGYRVSGQDKNVYPPMSTQLQQLGIAMHSGYDDTPLRQMLASGEPLQRVLVGNVMTRGMPVVETVLNEKLPFTSGPQWLGEILLRQRKVAAVAGTHGKTSTSAMLAWILQRAGQKPGFLIGGVPENFGISAQLGQGQAFVIEADEYDSAFFDKRSKFLHYHGDVVILNNLEYDHADIFPDLEAIKTQFHHLVRTIPASGRLIVNGDDANLADVLARGCWTPVTTFGDTPEYDLWGEALNPEASHIRLHRGPETAEFRWHSSGRHNLLNACAAAAAAAEYGIGLQQVATALAEFAGTRRRMERIGQAADITVYDDFAHHPTAIASTLAGAKKALAGGGHGGRLLAVFEPRSNSMRAGVHAQALPQVLQEADAAFVLMRPEFDWQDSARQAMQRSGVITAPNVDDLLTHVLGAAAAGDTVVFMSNGSFENAPRRFLALLEAAAGAAQPMTTG